MTSNQETTATDADVNNIPIYPQRLVFIQIANNCMFCNEPKGPAFTQYVHLDEKMGYIYCDKCTDVADAAIEYWHTNFAFGKANYLRNRIIQIKRTSGIIEGGWELYNPFIRTNDDGTDKVHCYNKRQNLVRWCILDDILKLNP